MRDDERPRDLDVLVLPMVGRLERTDSAWEPYRLLGADGEVVSSATRFFAELQASDRSVSTIRSYGLDLLRWWRFLTVLGVEWDRAMPADGRDFARWMKIADKPVRPHWRHRGDEAGAAGRGEKGTETTELAVLNPVTGKPGQGVKFSAATRAHAETVLRSFYEFQLGIGCGPLVNPFPLDRVRRAGRVHAHHDPSDRFGNERVGRYRPTVPKRIPRRIPDEQFNGVFAGLRSTRDRALLAFWVSTGVRAEELLSSGQDSPDVGQQVIAVTRKGSGAVQRVPASPDAFVWLRIYQEELWRRGAPRGRGFPLWFTLRQPWRRLSYPAARAMFTRAQALLGSNWTLHDLRHTAAYRMASDPELPLFDVQAILGHVSLTTTQLYLTQVSGIASGGRVSAGCQAGDDADVSGLAA
ncbi:tyrosine-type recombinase/integrase [Nocardia salmonicida]|uniref:tyrosine-type recombinase/integrase n=1 Tax=Nocardia salmonicida TaxID=53431 RepID=UPI003688A12C